MCYQLADEKLMCSRKAAEAVDRERDNFILVEHEMQEKLIRVKTLEAQSSLTSEEQDEYDRLVHESEKSLADFSNAMRRVTSSRHKWFETTEGQMYLSNRIHRAEARGSSDPEAERLLQKSIDIRESLLREWYNRKPEGGWCTHEPSIDELQMAVALSDDSNPLLVRARYVGHHGTLSVDDIYIVTECTSEGFVTLKRDIEESHRKTPLTVHHISLSDIRMWLA